jgi:hypothetical protein
MVDRRRNVQAQLNAARRTLFAPFPPPIRLSDDAKLPERQRVEAEARMREWRLARTEDVSKAMYFAMVASQDQIETTLRRRGHLPVKHGDMAQLLVPVDLGFGEAKPEHQRYFDLMGKTSFRKVVRAIIASGGSGVPLERLRQIAGEEAPGYVSALTAANAAREMEGGVVLNRQIDNIGPTLEWYVAQLCQRELGGSATWSVQLEWLPTGGDFDVLAWLDPLLLYVEVKSAHPDQVDESQLRNFLQRTVELAPDLAILLVDTDTRLAGLLDRLTGAMLPVMRKASSVGDDWQPDRPFIRPQKDYPGISFGFQRIYVTGAKPSIVTQLRRCLQHYHAHVKGAAFLPGPSMNFVTGEVGEEVL